MQKLLLPFILSSVTIAFGQSKYMTKSGSMSFEASQPTFEPIEASTLGSLRDGVIDALASITAPTNLAV